MKKYFKDKILITGGSGFIGSHISTFFLKKNYRIINFDLKKDKNLEKYSNYQFIKGDIRDEKNLRKAIEGVKYVFHLAYINGTHNFYIKPVEILEIASKGILNICKLSEEKKIKKLFVFSSSEVYHESKSPTDEKVHLKIPDPHNPRYSYSGGKIFSEIVSLNYANESKIKFVNIIRPHNVYGPNMGYGHVVPQLYSKIKKTKNRKKISIKIHGSGNEKRSFIYIDDFTSAFFKVFQNGKNKEIYNIGNNDPVTIKRLIKIFEKTLDKKISIKVGKLLEGSPKKRSPNVKKLINLGYKKNYPLEKGIKLYIKSENGNLK